MLLAYLPRPVSIYLSLSNRNNLRAHILPASSTFEMAIPFHPARAAVYWRYGHCPSNPHCVCVISRSITKAAKPTVNAIPPITLNNWKRPIYSSERIKERKSVFLGHASSLSSVQELSHFIDCLTALPALKRATHCMYAYRIIPEPTNPSKKLLGQHDGGEKGGGERLSRLLNVLDCQNVVVVVSRWYGGIPLGSDRWKLISRVAKEALHNANFIEQKTVEGNTTKTSDKNNNKRKKK